MFSTRQILLVLLLGAFFGCQNDVPTTDFLDASTREYIATANIALEKGEYETVLVYADSAMHRAPNAPEPYFLKGLAYSRTLKWEEADREYQNVIERDPGFPGVWNNRGNNSVRQGAYQQALSYFKKEIGLDPAPLPWSSIGRIYREIGMVDSATYAFQQAIQLDSTHVPAYLSYAAMLEDEGEYQSALELTEQAATLSPDNRETDYMLGSLLMRLEREAEAIPYLEKVTQEWSWHTESHYKLGQALQRVGREDESREVLTKAEKLWENQADITAYQKSLAMEPDNPYAHAALATALRIAGRYEEAIRTYNVALSLEPENLEFQNNLASLYFLKKDTTAAIQVYQNILSQNPEMIEVWVNLGILQALSGKAQDAREAWNKALEYKPGDPTIMGYLSRLEVTG